MGWGQSLMGRWEKVYPQLQAKYIVLFGSY